MPRKWDVEKVNLFVNENSDCKLISNEYINTKSELEFACKCGNRFKTSFEKFRLRNKRQCNECGREKTLNGRRHSYDFVKNFIKANSDCVLLSDTYNGVFEQIELECGCGEVFSTTFDSFKNQNKRTCNICSHEKRKQSLRYTYDEVKRFVEVESKSGCLLLSDEYVDIKSPLTFKCKCGEIFSTSFDSFRSGKNKTRCDKCTGKQSKGEVLIERWLRSKKIIYKRQFRFKECKSKKPLPFDFAIFDEVGNLKILIEYDGEQHFHPYRFKDNQVFEYKKLKNLKQRDEIKTQYCKENNINLLRIPYTSLNEIEHILENTL